MEKKEDFCTVGTVMTTMVETPMVGDKDSK